MIKKVDAFFPFLHNVSSLHCVKSVRIGTHWLWDIARKRNKFLLFSLVLILQLPITSEPLVSIQVGFSAKCTSPNEDFNIIEYWKSHMLDFRLISLDCITFSVWIDASVRNTTCTPAPVHVTYCLCM